MSLSNYDLRMIWFLLTNGCTTLTVSQLLDGESLYFFGDARFATPTMH
jgi:hypothetical protein